jgi:hypothetical protein
VHQILRALLLALVVVAATATGALGQEVVPTDTIPPTEEAETEFTPPASPTEELDTEAPAQPEATTSPTPPGDPDDEEGLGIGRIVVIVLLLAAGLGAARMLRRGPAGGYGEGATRDEPYDPEA